MCVIVMIRHTLQLGFFSLCEPNVTKTSDGRFDRDLRLNYYIITLTHCTYGHWLTNHVSHGTRACATVWLV